MDVRTLDRLGHYHICIECGCDFQGFEKQHTCWSCIKRYLENKGWIVKRVSHKRKMVFINKRNQ